jgi:hypothetical protein
VYISYADLLEKPSPVVAGFPGRSPFGVRLPLSTLPRSISPPPSRSRVSSYPPVWDPTAGGRRLPAILATPGGAGRLVVPAFPARAGLAGNGGWIHASAPMRPRSPGLGQVTTQSISGIASAGATTTASLLVALGTAPTIVGPIVAGLVAVANLLVGVFKGCGQTCVQASDIANQVEAALQQNLSQYMSAPVHYQSLQAAALNNFQTAWNALTQACGQAALATAGQNCISERQQGACSYKTSPGGWQQGTSGAWTYVYPGANGSGSTCWNWWIGYHDPIANDPTVVADPASSAAQSVITTGLTDVGLSPSTTIFGIPLSTLALPVLAGLAILLLMD